MAADSRGFTLVEMMLVLASGAVLALIALPTLTSAAAAAHTGAAVGELSTTILEAVRHSAMAGVAVVVCPDAGTGTCRDDITWNGGWIAFADLDGSRTRDLTDTLVYRAQPLRRGVALQSTSGRTRLVFQPNGGNVGSNITFTLCDRRGVTHAMSLVLANDGRIRTTAAAASPAERCVKSLGR